MCIHLSDVLAEELECWAQLDCESKRLHVTPPSSIPISQNSYMTGQGSLEKHPKSFVYLFCCFTNKSVYFPHCFYDTCVF